MAMRMVSLFILNDHAFNSCEQIEQLSYSITNNSLSYKTIHLSI